MRLIKPSFEIIEQESGLEGIYKQIELSGRTCYKSFDKITEDSAEPFVNRMMSNHHLSVLEHGTVYLEIKSRDRENYSSFYNKYKSNPYSHVNVGRGIMWHTLYITTNYRVLVENNWLDDLEYLCEPTESHEKRVTVRMVCSIGTSREFNRHRANSISEQSTRYCNFSKDKFGNEVTFIIPCWADSLALQEACKRTPITTDDFGNLIAEYYYHLNGKETPYFKTWEITPEQNFVAALQISEQLYLELLNQGWKPQQAREVLHLATATEVVYTAYVKDWIHFFELRCSEAAHPSARELVIPLKEEFIKRGWVNG